jgi:hypothetical protein
MTTPVRYVTQPGTQQPRPGTGGDRPDAGEQQAGQEIPAYDQAFMDWVIKYFGSQIEFVETLDRATGRITRSVLHDDKWRTEYAKWLQTGQFSEWLEPDQPAAPPEEEPDPGTPPTPTPTPGQNDLMAFAESILEQFGLNAPGLREFLFQGIAQGWSQTKLLLELRSHDAYLANPLFAANIENSKAGGVFMAEGEVISWAQEARRIARKWGYEAPTDSQLAQGLLSGKSHAEMESLIEANKRIETFGPAVQQFAHDYLGMDMDDEMLLKVFSKDWDTAEIDEAMRLAEMRGRPVALGFAARTDAEARMYERLGLNPDEVFSRFQSAQGVKSRTARLALIEADIVGQLNGDAIAEILKGHEDLVVKASVAMDPDAQRKVQDLLVNNVGRWKGGGGARQTQSGQQVGLLKGSERERFG